MNKSIDSADKLTDHDVTRAHRLCKSPRTDKPRPIIVRFSNFMDKMKVIKGRQSLREQGFGVSNDLSKNQRSELDKLKEKGKTGYYKNGHLYVIPSDASTDSQHDRVFKKGNRRSGNDDSKS